MTNPLLVPSTLPYELPDFAALGFEHYREAFEAGIAQHEQEIQAIVADPQPATFENTIAALERSGAILELVCNVFFNKVSADSDDQLRELEKEYAPLLAAHSDRVNLDAGLFKKISAVYDTLADSDLTAEERWLVERYHTEFVLRGAGLSEEKKEQLAQHNQRLSQLSTDFGNRLLADTNDAALHVTDVAELAGLSESQISTCREAAQSRGLNGYLITLILPTEQPYLATLTNRETRRRLMEASQSRGTRGNEFDTCELVLEITRLRAERAQLLGFANHAAYAVADQTAKTPEAIEELVYPMAAPAARNAANELAMLQSYADAECEAAGIEKFTLESWDWDFYAAKVCQERYGVDTEALRPYFEYERVLIDGVFWAATQVYGITFAERKDLVGYHPDVRIFEVFDTDGKGLALFLHDVYTRDSKRGGAWMNNLIDQSHLLGQKPIICNNLNVPKPAAGEPTLLSLDEVTTMFHEFGHALHGIFSDVTYPHVSGTKVSRDFVEFPSQVNEMWIQWPQVIGNYARHVETGEPIPSDILTKLKESALFGQGYATATYLASALLDQEWHKITPETQIESVAAFEAAALSRIGLDSPVVPPRYRSSYFNHTFSGGYDAGYYAYIWSEILDADTVAWFEENGGMTRANGDKFRAELLARGLSRDSLESYRQLRGRDAVIEPLLARRGLN
ncbi:MAG: M3 family metallopeptidase [Propionibacteriaceae bacterium]